MYSQIQSSNQSLEHTVSLRSWQYAYVNEKGKPTFVSSAFLELSLQITSIYIMYHFLSSKKALVQNDQKTLKALKKP